MRKYRSALWKPVMGISVFICLVLILSPGSVLAAHKLEGSQCFDCHVVGGSFDDVLDQSRLIKKDAKVSEILADAVWITGTPLPCAYCHDDTPYSVRENMIGVKDHFTGASLSSHPVNPYASNVGGVGDGGDGPNNLDCVDCHTLAAVSYVGQGASPGTTLSPNIHNQNTGAVAWTPAPGLLVAADTLEGGSPLNSLNNVFCTSRCHDVGQSSDFSSGQVLHSFSGTLVTIEHESGGSALSPAGCLSEGTYPDGCHGVHNVAENTDLIAIKKNASSYYGTGYVQRDECGICHIFDDPLRSTSDWIVNGHGRFETTNGIECTSCHDASIPHFQADGSPATGSSEGRLNFVLDTSQSGFSSPSKSLTSICSTCHAGKNPHSASDVGCLDCHDPHGYLVNGNNAMVRRTPPVASPASSLYYANQGDWYNSTSPPSSGNYSNYVCDQEDCHGGTGPGPIVDLMGGTHPGSYVSGCDTCHAHDNPRSFEARCDQCHGANESYWPAGGGDDGGTSPDNAGRHDIHRQKLEAELSYSPATTNDAEQRAMCQYCHDIGDSDHGSSTKAEVFASGGTALWGAPDANASHDSATRVCSNVDCHNSKATSSPYTWYETTSGTCTMCHTADASSPNVNAIADPTTGLHDVTPTVSGVQHDDNFSYSGSTADCTTCHTSTPSSSHLNGTANLSYPAVNLEATTIGFTDGTPPTCAPSLTGCHLEQDVSESWSRLWHDNSDQQDGTECAGCHGDWSGWNTGVIHRRDIDTDIQTHWTGTDFQCKDCHALEAATGYAFTTSSHDWNQNAGETSQHGNALITINDNGTAFSRNGTGLSGCNDGGGCHGTFDGTNTDGHSFTTSGWTLERVSGDTINAGCNGCHGGGNNGTPADNYWPDSDPSVTADDRDYEHTAHMSALAMRAYGESLGVLITDTGNGTADSKQKALCGYCHPNPFDPDYDPLGGGSTSSFTDTHNKGAVQVGGVYAHRLWDAVEQTNWDSTDNWTFSAGQCSDVDCHNRKDTGSTYAWDAGATADCIMCHTPGGGAVYIADPVDGLHDNTPLPTVSNEAHDDSFASTASCTNCHSNNMPSVATSQSSTHIDGTAKTDTGSNTATDFWLFTAYSDSAGNNGSCSGSAVNTGCHDGVGEAGNWSRRWSTTAYNADGTECANCHGGWNSDWTFGGGAHNSTDGNVEHEYDWDAQSDGAEVIGNHYTGASTPDTTCNICHVYKDSPYNSSAWANTWHGNNLIDMNDSLGYSSASFDCSSNCHDASGTHAMENSGWGINPVTGPALSCTSCHTGSGGGGKNVSSTSSHAQSAIGWNMSTYGITSCEDCHFSSHASQNAVAESTIHIPNNPVMGLSYSIGAGTAGVWIKGISGATTEADACWNCHAQVDATTALEFDGTGSWYKEGSLNQTKWYNGTSWAQWTSTDFEYLVDGTTAYKRNLTLNTTHDVGVTTTYPVSKVSHMNTSDRSTNRDNFRCTWCHDVHGLMGYSRKTSSQTYSNGNVSVVWGTASGEKVYLRGVWYSSPYNEDGAPGPGVSGGTTGGFTFPASVEGYIEGADDGSNTPGEVNGNWGNTFFWADTTTPSSTSANPPHLVGPNHLVRIQALSAVTDPSTGNDTDWPALKWGTHIDDNVYGTSGFYGHNPYRDNDNASNSTSLGTVNHYDYSAAGATGEQLCMKCHGTLANLRTNWSGHNAVRGGTAANTADIFTGTMGVHQHFMYNQAEGGWTQTTMSDTGYAGELTSDYGWGVGGYYDWSVNLSSQATSGTTVDTETAAINVTDSTAFKQKFHQFTCSKCHTPHASANARLMITNCMNRDTTAGTYNTWNDDANLNRLVGSQDANDRRNIFTDLPEPQNQGGGQREVNDPWINNFGGHVRAVHCHNNIENGSSSTFWQSLN